MCRTCDAIRAQRDARFPRRKRTRKELEFMADWPMLYKHGLMPTLKDRKRLDSIIKRNKPT